MEFRRDIQGLRAVAVLSVVAAHSGLLLHGGFIGVDVFFVISGYLIIGHIHRETLGGGFSVTEFYRRRVLRIIPALLATLTATLLVGLVVLLPVEYASLSRSAIAAVLSVSNVFFFKDVGYFASAAEFKPLLHTWSLGVEEQFYILVPVLAVVLTRMNRRHQLPVIVAAISVLSFIYSVVEVRSRPEAAFYLLPARLWELGLGGMLAMAGDRLRAKPIWREVGAGLGVALIGLPALLYDAQTPFPGLAAAPPCLGAALIIWAGAAGAPTLAGRLLSLPPLVFVGLVSYSFYLWHWPVLAYGRIAGLRGDVVTMAALVGLAFGLSVLAYYLAERPVLRLRGRIASGRVFATAAAAAAAVLLLPAAALATNGFVFRLTPSQRHLQAFVDYDTRANYDFGGCFIGHGEHLTSVYDTAACLRRPSPVLLIGDSFGAHLLPGVTAVLGKPKQATAAGCSPLVGMYQDGAASCAAVIGRVLGAGVPLDGVQTVIIGARWRDASLPHLRPTVVELRRRGFKVVVVGPIPEHERPVTRAMLMASLRGEPPRQSPGIAATWALDRRFRAALADMPGVTYVSPMQHFCGPQACRMMVGADPVQWDWGHLTAAASIDLLRPALAPLRISAPPSP